MTTTKPAVTLTVEVDPELARRIDELDRQLLSAAREVHLAMGEFHALRQLTIEAEGAACERKPEEMHDTIGHLVWNLSGMTGILQVLNLIAGDAQTGLGGSPSRDCYLDACAELGVEPIE